MPLSYRIPSDLIVFESNDEYQWSDMLKTLKKALSSVEHGKKVKLIFDERNATYLPSTEELRQIVEYIKGWRHLIKKIALVVGKPVQYGMGRVAEVYLESEEGAFKVFYDMEQASQWLEQEES
jgi:hypothetical protein